MAMESTTDSSVELLILREALKRPIILDFSPTSPFSHFACQEGCQECCGYTYFLPKEVEGLPAKIKEQLILMTDGKYEVKKVNNRCIFFKENSSFFCSIYQYRPLRCRIYPYFPLIVDGRILITLEPSLKMLNSPVSNIVIDNCPGIGKKGKKINDIIKDCLTFIEKLADAPRLLGTVILTTDQFNNIRNDRWFIERDY